MEFAEGLKEKLYQAGLRVEIDSRSEKVGYKIREAQLEKNPYMLVIGDKEVDGADLAVRSRDEGELGTMHVDAFIERLQKEIKERSL